MLVITWPGTCNNAILQVYFIAILSLPFKMFWGHIDGNKLVFLYMFLYIFVKYIIYWMTRMTCSKDAWFVKGSGVHARLLSKNNTCCMVCWPHYFHIYGHICGKKAVASSKHWSRASQANTWSPLFIYHSILSRTSAQTELFYATSFKKRGQIAHILD